MARLGSSCGAASIAPARTPRSSAAIARHGTPRARTAFATSSAPPYSAAHRDIIAKV
jgi:hypothetical protein